jgi:hypothetical protein
MSNEQWKKKIRQYLRHDSLANFHAEAQRKERRKKEEEFNYGGIRSTTEYMEVFFSHNTFIENRNSEMFKFVF